MTDAKLDKLRLSVQGMKTQQGYMRERIDRLESREARIDRLEFLVRLCLVSIGVFFATLIICYLTR